jgi:uncharacterized GH25 family protein
MKITQWGVLVLLVVLWTVPSVWGHDYWIMPESFRHKGNDVTEAAFTQGHHYFDLEEVPDISKYRISMVTPQNREIPLSYSRVEAKAAWISIPLAGPGTYVISAASTAPGYFCQTTDGWKTGRKSEHENVLKAGKYVKSVKSFVTVERPTDSYKMLLGHTIEIIPQKNPTELKVGQILPILVLYQGRPVADVPVFGIYEGYKPKDHSDQPVKTTTKENGIAEVKLSRAGKWLVYAKYEFDTPASPHADFENYRPYMMIEVK